MENLKDSQFIANELARKHANIHPTKELDFEERYYNSNVKHYDSFIEGFNAYKELTKEKLFTIDDIKEVIELAREGRTCIGGGSDYVEDGYANDCVDWEHETNEIIKKISEKYL